MTTPDDEYLSVLAEFDDIDTFPRNHNPDGQICQVMAIDGFTHIWEGMKRVGMKPTYKLLRPTANVNHSDQPVYRFRPNEPDNESANAGPSNSTMPRGRSIPAGNANANANRSDITVHQSRQNEADHYNANAGPRNPTMQRDASNANADIKEQQKLRLRKALEKMNRQQDEATRNKLAKMTQEVLTLPKEKSMPPVEMDSAPHSEKENPKPSSSQPNPAVPAYDQVAQDENVDPRNMVEPQKSDSKPSSSKPSKKVMFDEALD